MTVAHVLVARAVIIMAGAIGAYLGVRSMAIRIDEDEPEAAE